MEFSERLQELRRSKGISQAALAQAIHISRSAVAKWENGLGLPGADSLALLADYFGVTAGTLLGDEDTARALVEKNRAIENQSNVIIGFAVGARLALFLLAFLCVPSLRDYLTMVALGVFCVVLGAFNLKGNIASIHWYNRRKVSREDQLPYCRLMGWGTLVIGAGMILSAIVSAMIGSAIGELLILPAVVIGLALMLVAQFKYNRGIF